MKEEHFEGEGIFIFFVGLMILLLGEKQGELVVDIVQRTDDDEVDEGGRNGDDDLRVALHTLLQISVL